MPDEDSNLATQTQQTSTTQTWDDDFVLSFWDEEATDKVIDSWEKTDEIFDIDKINEENKDTDEINFNQDDLFGEIPENKDENIDLWNTFADTEKNDADNNEDSNDFFADMNLDGWNNSNQNWNSVETSEENDELFEDSEPKGSEVDMEDNINIENNSEEENNSEVENGVELENNQDELFWETEEENIKLKSQESESLSMDLQDNRVDALMGMEWNSISLEEKHDTSLTENDVSSDNTEKSFSNDVDNNLEESSDIANENMEENSWADLFWETRWENNNIEWQLNQGIEIEDTQKENDEDKFEFSFDSTDPNESIQTNKAEEVINNSNDSELMPIVDWNEITKIRDNSEQEENINDINFEPTSDYNEDSDQNEIQNSGQDNEELEEKPQNSDIKNVDNDLFWSDPILQNGENESETDVTLENTENSIQDERVTESNEWNIKDNQNIFQDESFEWNDKSNWELLLNDKYKPWDENIDDKTEETQELPKDTNADSVNAQNASQPDMMNLLWWQPVDFSYEENTSVTEQSKSDLGINQKEPSDNLQNSVLEQENNNQIENLAVGEKSDINTMNSKWNTMDDNSSQSLEENKNPIVNINNPEPQSQTIEQNMEENKVNEISKDQVNDNIQNQVEVWAIKSTLSLDEILDSELQSNPQFIDNSKSIPKNIQTKSTFFGGRKSTIFIWIWVFLLFCIVAALAFPTTSTERKAGDVISAWVEIQEPEESTQDAGDPKEYIAPEEKKETLDQWNEEDQEKEQVKKNHWSWPTTELIEEYTQDEIKPYINVESEEPEEPEEPNEKKEIKKISIEDIQSKISSFKTQGEWYKKVGENNSNEKVIKYAAYVVRLCDEYQSQIDNWEGVDLETFSSFENKVIWFISKIEKNLNWWDEVSTIYTKVDFDEDDDKKDLRTFLTETK